MLIHIQVAVEILEYADFKLITTNSEEGQNKQNIDEIRFLCLWTLNHNMCSDFKKKISLKYVHSPSKLH